MAPESTIRINETSYTLEGLETLAWDLLSQGARSNREPFHNAAMATLDDEGFPTVRHMVLRHVDIAERLLACYTDLRAPKVDGLSRDGRTGWAFWDPHRRIQVRATGKTLVHAGGVDADAITQDIWEYIGAPARHGYSHVRVSGSVRETPPTSDEIYDAALFSQTLSDASFVNFGLLLTRVRCMDILHLHHTGHRRARFSYDSAGNVRYDWITA